MSRLRTIKPGFFLDEVLADCEPLARILFAGLWCVADREGRLEDRPKRIKVECLPYDECDVDDLLNELSAHGFIIRYQDDGRAYIAVPKWAKHQNPHVKEAASVIPAPDKNSTSTTQAPNVPGRSCLVSCHGSGDLSNPSFDAEPSNASFDAFWTAYPKKADKKKAATAWKHLTAKQQKEAQRVADLMGKAVAAGRGQDRAFIMLPTTFIHGERWHDWDDGPPDNWAVPTAAQEQPSCTDCGAFLTFVDGAEHCPVCVTPIPSERK
jgi:hypothetical protein